MQGTDCATCIHFDVSVSTRNTCRAFPNGIPDSVFGGSHRKPITGDNGIVWTPLPAFARKGFREDQPRDEMGRWTDDGGGGGGGGEREPEGRAPGIAAPRVPGDHADLDRTWFSKYGAGGGKSYGPDEFFKDAEQEFGKAAADSAKDILAIGQDVIDEVGDVMETRYNEGLDTEPPYQGVLRSTAKVSMAGEPGDNSVLRVSSEGWGSTITRVYKIEREMSQAETRIDEETGEEYEDEPYEIGRKFIVEHSYFKIPKGAQGARIATRMLAASVESYMRAGVDEIQVHANIDVGGYAWASLGFKTSDPDYFKDEVERRTAQLYAEGHGITMNRIATIIREVRERGEDAPLWLASQPEGQDILLDSDWPGYLPLKTPDGKQVARTIIEKGKKYPKPRKG